MAMPTFTTVSPALRFGVTKQLLQKRNWYDGMLRPFLQSLHPHTHTACRILPPNVLALARPDGKTFVEMDEMLRNPRGSVPLGIEALNTIHLFEQRLALTENKSFANVDYAFEVGDVVRHSQLGQLGVVAARLPLCVESDEWLAEHIGSTTDARMAHPWYLILVAHHTGLPIDFLRYGSQLTHEKLVGATSIGFHRCLPIYFKAFDADAGRYIPRAVPPAATLSAGPLRAPSTKHATSTRSTAVPVPSCDVAYA